MVNAKRADSLDSPVVARWTSRLTMVETSAGAVSVLDEGTGAPVVLLHGIPTHSWLWRDVARILQINHRVIAPDLVGFGFSTKADGLDLSPAGQADVVLEVLERLDVETFTLVGHDYGALVACEIVSRDAERVERLVVTNTSLNHEDWHSHFPLDPLAVFKIPVLGEAVLKIARPTTLREPFALFVAERSRLDAETMEMYWQPFNEGFDRTLLRLSREVHLDEDTFHDWKAALYDYQRPALVVWGALDPMFQLDRAHDIVRLFSNCHFESFMHSNHFIQEDRPQALGRLIASFAEGRLDD